MLYFSTSKKFLLLIICLLGFFLALPNFWNVKIPFLPKQTINLGLDLRGGSYLLLEVDTNSIKKDKAQSLVEDIRSSLRQEKIKYIGLKTLPSGAEVKIQDNLKLNDARKAIEALNNSTSANIFNSRNSDEFSLDEEGGIFKITLNESSLNEKYRLAVSQSIEIIRRRIGIILSKSEYAIPPPERNTWCSSRR